MKFGCYTISSFAWCTSSTCNHYICILPLQATMSTSISSSTSKSLLLESELLSSSPSYIVLYIVVLLLLYASLSNGSKCSNHAKSLKTPNDQDILPPYHVLSYFHWYIPLCKNIIVFYCLVISIPCFIIHYINQNILHSNICHVNSPCPCPLKEPSCYYC